MRSQFLDFLLTLWSKAVDNDGQIEGKHKIYTVDYPQKPIPMIQNTEIAVLPFKVLELAEIIAEKKRLSIDDALFYLYNSTLYKDLIDPKLKLWYYSGVRLYELLEDENTNKKKAEINKSELQFLIFCIEQYRLNNNLTSAGVLSMFIRYGVDKFLRDNFEVLHSQSEEYILDEISRYLKNRKLK